MNGAVIFSNEAPSLWQRLRSKTVRLVEQNRGEHEADDDVDHSHRRAGGLSRCIAMMAIQPAGDGGDGGGGSHQYSLSAKLAKCVLCL
jgi:hypothetical protein